MSAEVQLTIANFSYEKKNGTVSDRKIIVISHPSDSLFGVEITGNDLTEIQPLIDYLVERTELDEKLREKHGIKGAKFPYKTFSQGKIDNFVESNITVKA